MNSCRWCEKPAIVSHIIPAALNRFMKKRDKAYTVRELDNPNLALQDFLKLPLLCSKHDGMFSQAEDKFVSEIFRPLQSGVTRFTYDQWFGQIAVFMAWKRLETCKPFDNVTVDEVLMINKALSHWEGLLLGKHADLEPYQHYFFLTKLIASSDLKEFEHLILNENFGSSVLISQDNVYVITLMPGCMFVSPLSPDSIFDGGSGVKIEPSGEFNDNQIIPGSFLRTWLQRQVKECMASRELVSSKQWAKITKP